MLEQAKMDQIEAGKDLVDAHKQKSKGIKYFFGAIFGTVFSVFGLVGGAFGTVFGGFLGLATGVKVGQRLERIAAIREKEALEQLQE